MQKEQVEPDFNKFRAVRRKAINLTQTELVKTSYLKVDSNFPLVMEPAIENVNLQQWAENNRALIETELLKHGAILFRGFKVQGATGFEQFARTISPDLLDYTERAAPRTEVGEKVYTSTEFPADQHIPLHHEMSYSHNWPTKIWFFCAQPAQAGGATPIADDRKIFKLLDPKIKEIFIRKKVLYTRNYGYGLDLTWQDAFQTTDRSKVAEYCRKAHTEFEWKDGDCLKTRQVRQAIATHPKTGDTVWFNHAHMFHLSNLEPLVRESLLEEFDEQDLPRNAYYGDGSPIESSVLEQIRGLYWENAVAFQWQDKDILMLDNFLASHGREPFVGPRRILVAMAELYVNNCI